MDGAAMSKSRGNIVEPKSVVDEYGADTLRATVLFAGPIEDDVDWADVSPAGMHRWLARLCRLVDTAAAAQAGDDDALALRRMTAKTVAALTTDYGAHKYNTAIAKLMSLANEVTATLNDGVQRAHVEALEALLVMLAPIAPHVTEELWHRLGHDESIHVANWPVHDPALLVEERRRIVVQVNGKVRDTLDVDAGAAREFVEAAARTLGNVARHLDGEIVKVVWVPDRLLNFVVR